MSAFDRALQLKQRSTPTGPDESEYDATFEQASCIGNVPHGGFVTSLLLHVASTFAEQLTRQSSVQADPIHLYATFLNRSQTGSVLCRVRRLKSGRNYSVYRVMLVQEDLECVHSYIQMSNLSTESGISLQNKKHPVKPSWRDLPERDAAFSEFRQVTRQFIRRSFDEQAFNMDQNRFLDWIAFKDGRTFDTCGLGIVADMANPIPWMIEQEDHKMRWYPTVILELEIKQRPQPDTQWVSVQSSTKVLLNGRNDLDVEIRQEDGTLLATSRHVALVVDASRNLQKRGSSSKL